MIAKLAVFTATLGCGGAERVLSTLINYWTEEKMYDITLFTQSKEDSFYKLHPDIKRHNLKSKIPKNKLIVLTNVGSYISELKEQLKENKINRLICFGRSPNCIGSIINKSIQINTIICERSSPFYKENYIWSMLPKLYYKYASNIILQTHKSKPYFEDLFTLPKNVSVIENPISDDFIKSPKNDNRKNIILSVGRLHPLKGHNLLIKALTYITEWKDWKVHIIGEGSERKSIEQSILDNKLGDRVKLLGKISNVKDHYNNAKIFVLTSSSEGYPNALIEATVMGCACISFDCNFGPSEIIKNNESGILIKDADYESLGKSLQKLMLSTEIQNSLSTQSWNQRERFSIDKVSKKWIKVIEGEY